MAEESVSGKVPSAEQGAGKPEATPDPEPQQPKGIGIPVVGLGASAGGLAALEAFFRSLPPSPGMAFVIVQHLDPAHKSILIELIQRHTSLPVAQAAEGMPVEADHVYVIPPNRDLALLRGRLHLFAPTAPRGLRLPIDFFFRTLAQDQGERAIGIVLSGTGTDGTLGLKAIKGEGGLVLVQSPESAEYDGMPRSAMAIGVADAVLPPADMPTRILTYARRAFRGQAGEMLPSVPGTEADLEKVCVVLRTQTGHDFSEYKPSTLGRRVVRRMAVAQLDRLDEYMRYLQATPAEGEALFRDLLIGVTAFFRDPDAFSALVGQAIPALLSRAREQSLRIWVPACATGEEAYSLAMLLQEGLDAGKMVPGRIQIYATDLDPAAIDYARAGLYPENIVADVSPARLSRFFAQEDHAYRVAKALRDVIVFATHDVIRDPPFSRLDLISCRNLLIYLNAELQHKLVPVFHYALQPDGFLWLGPAESIETADLFAVVDRRWKLYQRRPGVGSRAFVQMASHTELRPLAAPRKAAPGVKEITEQALLQAFSPAAALVTGGGDVLYVYGRTGRYLELSQGDARMDVLAMAREGLRLPLGAALHKAAATRSLVRYDGVRVQTNGDTAIVNLIIRPIVQAENSPLFLVLFEEMSPSTPPAEPPAPVLDAEQRLAELEQQLGAKETYLQATVEELHAANEELRSANEELQAGNEELQSTNEELETAKEELQAVNEELQTVNAELQQKIGALGRANNDMTNLLAGTGVATIFVDHDLNIRRFTPAATQIMHLLGTDIGRPVGDLASRLKGYTAMVEDTRKVLDTLVPVDAEVQSVDGQWFAMRLQPYRTQENVIEGAVLTFMDITRQKALQDQMETATHVAQEAQAYAETMLDTMKTPVLVLDSTLTVRAANAAYFAFFQAVPEATIGRQLEAVVDWQWAQSGLRTALEELLQRGTPVTNLRVDLGARKLFVKAREVRQGPTGARRLLLSISEGQG